MSENRFVWTSRWRKLSPLYVPSAELDVTSVTVPFHSNSSDWQGGEQGKMPGPARLSLNVASADAFCGSNASPMKTRAADETTSQWRRISSFMAGSSWRTDHSSPTSGRWVRRRCSDSGLPALANGCSIVAARRLDQLQQFSAAPDRSRLDARRSSASNTVRVERATAGALRP